MPLFAPPHAPSDFESSLAVGARAGTNITASGTPHAEGSWTQLIAATSRDSYGIWVMGRGLQTSGAATSSLMDIGLGTTELISNILMGSADIANRGFRVYYFPVFVPSGSQVQARHQALIASDVLTTFVTLEKRPQYPFIASRCTTYGAVTASSYGTSVTPGNGAYGSWTNIGSTTSRDHYLWNVGLDFGGDAGIAASGVLVEIGYSSGNRIAGPWWFDAGATEQVNGAIPPVPVWFPVPSGTQMQARVAYANTTDISTVILYGMD